MTRTSFEEAKACPKCGQPGLPVSNEPQEGSRIHVFECETGNCRWFQTRWSVEVLPNGTIPQRERGVKEFEITSAMENLARRNLEVVKHELDTGEIVRDRNAFNL